MCVRSRPLYRPNDRMSWGELARGPCGCYRPAMLSYQHAYHAGNAADVHKHALLAQVLDYMTRKAKPMVYMETHAGRALYDLDGPEATKTGEAAQGIAALERDFAADHPYLQALEACRAAHGPSAYPGSPWIARHLLRPEDTIVLCERHPAEAAALREALPGVTVLEEDGPSAILSRCPPTPRRGLVLVDPSYEVKTEWQTTPRLMENLHRKWPVGVLMLWSPVLATGAHDGLAGAISAQFSSQVDFPPARAGHKMIGSRMDVWNPPYGLA